MQEAPFRNLTPLTQATAQAIVKYLDRPFAFFGHSMGAKLAFELARLLRDEHDIEPVHLFVSGSRAPHIPSLEPPTYDLPEAEFIEELRNLNGTPQEVLDHPELMQLMIPLLRADFEVVQTYDYKEGPPLNCPITAFGGIEDHDVTREHIEAWRRHTASSFVARMFPGDHFFVNKARETLLSVVARELQPYITYAA